MKGVHIMFETVIYEVKNNIRGIEFNSCIFDKVDLSKVKIEKIDFIDCFFYNCDLSNIDFEQVNDLINLEVKKSTDYLKKIINL